MISSNMLEVFSALKVAFACAGRLLLDVDPLNVIGLGAKVRWRVGALAWVSPRHTTFFDLNISSHEMCSQSSILSGVVLNFAVSYIR